MTKRPILEPGIGRRIVQDSLAPPRRPKDDPHPDHLPELNAYRHKFLGGMRINLQIPVSDAVALARTLRFLSEEIGPLRMRLMAIPDREARSVQAAHILRAWNQQFARWCGTSNAPKSRTRRKKPRQAQGTSAIVPRDLAAITAESQI